MVAEGSWIGRVPLRVQSEGISEQVTRVPTRAFVDWVECDGYDPIPPEERRPGDKPTRRVTRPRRMLVWSEREETERLADGCLAEFLRLQGKRETEILNFAQRWGCWSAEPLVLEEDGQILYGELIEDWTRVVNFYFGVVLAATRVEANRPIEPRIFSLLYHAIDSPDFEESDETKRKLVDDGWRNELAGIATRELAGAQVVPVLDWREDGPATMCVNIESGTFDRRRRRWDFFRMREENPVSSCWATSTSRPSMMRAALAIQLAAALTYDSMVAACSACGDIFLPERKPRPDKGRYCSDDCRQEAHRQVLRQSYRRRKGKYTK